MGKKCTCAKVDRKYQLDREEEIRQKCNKKREALASALDVTVLRICTTDDLRLLIMPFVIVFLYHPS